jgi:hypothetical protein
VQCQGKNSDSLFLYGIDFRRFMYIIIVIDSIIIVVVFVVAAADPSGRAV